ncbi:MAG: hypothetical protein PHY23_10150 [Oscillospiraceae bacterium]|nr:hypothetical protein [Oscillospiraceae bacterium]
MEGPAEKRNEWRGAVILNRRTGMEAFGRNRRPKGGGGERGDLGIFSTRTPDPWDGP